MLDLVPQNILEKWVQYLQAQCPTFVFKSSVHIQDKTVVCTNQQLMAFWSYGVFLLIINFLLDCSSLRKRRELPMVSLTTAEQECPSGQILSCRCSTCWPATKARRLCSKSVLSVRREFHTADSRSDSWFLKWHMMSFLFSYKSLMTQIIQLWFL